MKFAFCCKRGERLVAPQKKLKGYAVNVTP